MDVEKTEQIRRHIVPPIATIEPSATSGDGAEYRTPTSSRDAAVPFPQDHDPSRRPLDDEWMTPSVLEQVAGMRARVEELEGLIETSPDALLHFGIDGRIWHANAALRALLDDGTDPTTSRVEDHTAFRTMRTPDGYPLTNGESPITRVLHGDALVGLHTVDVLLTTPKGHEVLLNCAGMPVCGAAGQVRGGVLALRDATDRWLWQQRLRAANEQLADSAAERAQMINMVAHELRQPLTTIKGYTQLTSRTLARANAAATEEEAREWTRKAHERLRAVDESFAMMERLVLDLLETGRIGVGRLVLEYTHTDLHALCEEEAERQQAATGRPVTLALPEEPVEVEVDVRRIQQVLGNLLANALKYSPPERPVTVELRGDSTTATISVRDEGPGIPPEDLPRIFERFYQVPGIHAQHGAGGGLGLGLYLCQSFVEAHGGRMDVHSVPGEGSTFSFTLPRHRPGQDARADPSA